MIACWYEVYVGYPGIFEGLYGFYYVDYRAARTNAYIAGCRIEVLFHGPLGGASFGELNVGRGGRHSGEGCEEGEAARVLSQEETIFIS